MIFWSNIILNVLTSYKSQLVTDGRVVQRVRASANSVFWLLSIFFRYLRFCYLYRFKSILLSILSYQLCVDILLIVSICHCCFWLRNQPRSRVHIRLATSWIGSYVLKVRFLEEFMDWCTIRIMATKSRELEALTLRTRLLINERLLLQIQGGEMQPR